MSHQKFDHLILEVISSSTMQKGKLIMINPLGLYGDDQSCRALAQAKKMQSVDAR